MEVEQRIRPVLPLFCSWDARKSTPFWVGCTKMWLHTKAGVCSLSRVNACWNISWFRHQRTSVGRARAFFLSRLRNSF